MMYGLMEEKQNNIKSAFQEAFEQEKLFSKVIEFFPYPILIYSADGRLVRANRAILKDQVIPVPHEIVGTYNVLQEPFIMKSGVLPDLQRAFRGETVVLLDRKVPLEYMFERYQMPDSDIVALYQDLMMFPLFDADQSVSFVVVILINKRIYRGKDEIVRAKEYIEMHCLDRFNADESARAAGLSRAHFTRLFKKHMHMTPHEYYISCKIGRLKERLLDVNLSISQAFSECGMDYNGHYAKVFKENVGVSPSVYRETAHPG
ncbi:MAG: helix-turn-helix domain-containing protein [Lawsonibacter sp.]